jgi:hypothetical protein
MPFANAWILAVELWESVRFSRRLQADGRFRELRGHGFEGNGLKTKRLRCNASNKPLRTWPYRFEAHGGNKEGNAYQDAEGAPNERISMFSREDTLGSYRLCVNKRDKSECRKSECQDD